MSCAVHAYTAAAVFVGSCPLASLVPRTTLAAVTFLWVVLVCCTQEGGVQMADGDGTVPVLSLGALCEGGWSSSRRLNPGNATVVTREYQHKPSKADARQGGVRQWGMPGNGGC